MDIHIIEIIKKILVFVNYFFSFYLIGYSTYLFLSSIIGSYTLYKNKRNRKLSNRIKNDYNVPISILVPAYNEETTVVETVLSLLDLDYKIYEIIVVDDGSKDKTSEILINYFNMVEINKTIKSVLDHKPIKTIYETTHEKVRVILVKKENGGKADALNAGINVSSYPYFTCMDADSMLQRDSLEKIVGPIFEDERVVACGGNVRISNNIEMENGYVKNYNIPNKILDAMQVIEYDRSFLASRILFDQFNGNLIISGAFGLFKKSIVMAVGGYDSNTVGEDFELVLKLHVFCRMHKIDYIIRYVPDAICWSQAPNSITNLYKQRKRWNKGLLQGMLKYKELFLNPRYGLISLISFLYYLIYELLSPFIEIIGILTVITSYFVDLLNIKFMIVFTIIYIIYNSTLSFAIFVSRLHVENIKITFYDFMRALLLSILEITVLRLVVLAARFSAFVDYKKKKNDWDKFERHKNKYNTSK